ncbi:hypothetical protein BDY19DRAFT_987984 [Irpex rosettiformis]|uniref:Uncharacterized protein n=1 Tax=Irpex rosettiformis TaxID=378272 RepID=A0ACB8TM54_9APHY|nr:hypothetical protein BDY19DRAFT_987984 [Irpex rosettiformis]
MHLIWENVSRDYKGSDTGRENYGLSAMLWEAIGSASAASGSTIPSAFGPRSPNIASEKVSWTADSRSFWTLFVALIVLKGRFTHDKYYNHFVDFVELINKCLQYEIEQSEVAEVREGFICWVKKYEEFYYQHNPSHLSACPLTIHALLHIADSIVSASPRYCRFIQPAFKSRRFPFASINRFILDHARLSHIRILYDATDALSLGTTDMEDNHCAFLPSSRIRTFEQGITNKIIGALCTPYDSPIGASARNQDDSCDATFVRYQLLVDINARAHNRPLLFAVQTFYGRLMHVVVVNVGAIPSQNIPATHVVLAIIRSCKVDEHHPKLDIHYYSEEGALDVVDVTTVQCLVGRVYDRERWAIFDRSDLLSRAVYIEGE